MKKLITRTLCTILFTTLIGCSKSSETKPLKTGSVTISGTTYATVVLGSQTWTSINYDGPGGMIVPNVDENAYGKLYKWSEAEAVALPEGWRIPTANDFITLLKTQGSVNSDGSGLGDLDTSVIKNLKSTSGWTINGDNKSGFNAQPAGYYNYYLNMYGDQYAFAYFWGTTVDDQGPNPAQRINLVLTGYYTSPGTGHTPIIGAGTQENYVTSELSYSLRFVKDN